LKVAEAGHKGAFHGVAACYSRGVGTKIDRTKQLFWEMKSAEVGNAQS